MVAKFTWDDFIAQQGKQSVSEFEQHKLSMRKESTTTAAIAIDIGWTAAELINYIETGEQPRGKEFYK